MISRNPTLEELNLWRQHLIFLDSIVGLPVKQQLELEEEWAAYEKLKWECHQKHAKNFVENLRKVRA